MRNYDIGKKCQEGLILGLLNGPQNQITLAFSLKTAWLLLHPYEFMLVRNTGKRSRLCRIALCSLKAR